MLFEWENGVANYSGCFLPDCRLRSPPATSDKLPQKEVRSHEPAEAQEEAKVEAGAVAVVLRWRVEMDEWVDELECCCCVSGR